MLRVGMTNPPYILEHLENLVPILNHPRVYAYLHIPVQAGSDAVLEAMKREYTCAEFEHIVGFLRTRVPDMTIATDIIAAFPTETEQDFQLTMDMINRQQFAIMNFTQFYPRPGTPAAKMKRVMSTREARKRTKAISEVFEAWAPYTKLVGRTVRVWTTGEMARDKKHMIGHTKNYTQVLIPCDDTLFGASMEVCITGAGRWSVFGTIVPGTAVCAPIDVVPLAASKHLGLVDTHSTEAEQAEAASQERDSGCCGGGDDTCGCEEPSGQSGPSSGCASDEGACACDGSAASSDAKPGGQVEGQPPNSTAGSGMLIQNVSQWSRADQGLVCAFVIVCSLFVHNLMAIVQD